MEEDSKRVLEHMGVYHCLEAINGKHCVLTCPHNSGSAFYDYKGSFSIV